MDPTVTAAWIGGGAVILSGGWTALVAITTTRSARRTNQATLNAAAENTKRTLDAAREARIWDRREDAYVETLAAIHNRQVRRGIERGTQPMDQRLRAGMQALASKYEMDAAGLEARLQAFGSEPVFSAVQASSTADRDAVDAYDTWRTAVAAPGTTPGNLEKARRAADVARKAADDADDAVVEQVRRELGGVGDKPLGNWEYFPTH
jgi:hypothetical protein